MDFSTIAQQLIEAATHDPVRAVELFHELCPSITGQIRADVKRKGPLSFWGRSSNIDELASQTIVAPEIIELIAKVADRKLSTRTPHAGLQHTYGYLFSLIPTPFGMKRDRWVETKLEAAFGLASSTLGPDPDEGTLLANATWLSGKIAFRAKPGHMQRLESYLAGKYSPDLDEVDFEHLPQTRILEKLQSLQEAKDKSWVLQTDLVPFPNDTTTSLLVYSVVEEHSNNHVLITLFPVGQATHQGLLSGIQPKQRADIRPRFNTHIPALGTGEFEGTCELQQFAN